MSIDKNMIKLSVLAAVAILTLVARFIIINPNMAALLIIKCGYWAIALTFAGFVILLARQLPHADTLRKQYKVHRMGLLCILLAAVYLQTNEPREFKVLFDEFAISGVARNMHFEREATFPSRAHYINGRLIVIKSAVDKRPFFFQYIVSLAHDLTGYRPQNAFYVNALLSVLLLFGVYISGSIFGGSRLGCFGVFLLAGLPLIAQNSTDGGYDLLNLVMILALFFSGSLYYKNSGTQGLNLFILSAILLAQVRYESILYVLVVPVVAICKWCHEKRITMTWMAALSPAMILTPLLSNEVLMSDRGFFQTKPGQAFFSFDYLAGNLGKAIYYLFNFDFNSTNSVLLSALGIISIVFFILYMARNAKELFIGRKNEIVLASVFIVAGASTILALCCFWGQWDDPMVSRFSLPLQLLMVLLTLRVAIEFFKSKPFPRWAAITAGIWIACFSIPASARHFPTSDIVTAQEYSWLAGYLANKDPAVTLTISGSSIGPILYNMPAISIDEAKRCKWQVKACLSGEFYHEIIVLQRFIADYKSGKYIETGPTPLGEGFKLETIAERYFRPDVLSRISRIVDVDLSGVSAPEGFEKEKPPFKNEPDYVTHLLRKLP